ncbi:MAG: GWxTD domain-containing protein, partial [Gemmatimonadetes bacterium]|nr:GWxTD domain-containing protein [Gemmatimonadota bacterium]
ADGRWEAALSFALEVRRGDEVVLKDAWQRTKSVADRRMLDSSRLFFVETHAFMVPPGTYELEGTISDASGAALGTLRQTLEAPQENPPASDLLLAARIVADTAGTRPEGYDPVRKNRLVLNANPGQVYSSRVSPLLYFYYEFENVRSEPLPLVRVLRFQTRGAAQVVKEVRVDKTYKPGWTVDFGAVNIAGLKPGDYTLELSWDSPQGAELPEAYRGLSRREDFVFVRERAPAPVTATPSGLQPGTEPGRDYYESFTVAGLDSVFEMMDVFFTARERQVYRGLTLEGKRTFLNQFWGRKDSDPSTAENEYKAEVEGRLAYVESTFGNPSEEGWQTPRGRVYLKHGKPDRKVERVLETGFSSPYEIWIYYGTGYKYVFLDEFRNRRYILLTSTDPEEQGRPDWQERVPAETVQDILRE